MKSKKILLFISIFLGGLKSFCTESKIPFVYLNQYFNFEIINDHEITLAERRFNFNSFIVDAKFESVKIDLKDLKNFKLGGSYLIFKDIKGQEKISRTELTPSQLEYEVANDPSFTHVCLRQSSAFSRLEVCKKINDKGQAINSNFNSMTKVDGANFDRLGTVVLKDKKDAVLFEAFLSDTNYLRLVTKKRKIYPRRMTKESADDFLKIQFLDLDLKTNNTWNTQINLDQTYFLILLDPILKMRQDIYLNDSQLKMSSVNFMYVEAKKNDEPEFYDNEFNAEFVAVYLGLIGSSSALKARLNSDLGRGLHLGQRWLAGPKLDGIVNATIFQTNIIPDSANSVYNSSQLIYGMNAGVSYHLAENINLVSLFQLQKDLFIRSHDATTNSLDITSALNKEIHVAPEWIFFRDTNSTAIVNLGFNYILATTADGESVSAGTSYELGLSYSYRISSSQLRIQTGYSKRAQNTESFNFFEQMAFYGIGYQYLF